MRVRNLTHLAMLLPIAVLARVAAGQAYLPPEHVDVVPVFLVPIGQTPPTAEEQDELAAHLAWSQERFQEMLDCRGTFAIRPGGPLIHQGAFRLADYQQMPEGGAPQWVAELLEHEGYDRFDLPFIYCIVVMNPAFDFPGGGGRPCNGGFNTGGGVIVLSSYALNNHPHFQSTLQHELGHAFGLPHVDVYGYDMQTNASIMSYNPAHHTNGFEPSTTPGVLIPEDVRGLAFNDRVLARLAFHDDADLPAGYELAPPVWLGPMEIPGQDDHHVGAFTSSGEAYGSSAQNAVQGQIKPSRGPGITFDPFSMWHSDPAPSGSVALVAHFPGIVVLDTIAVHSQHSGQYHAANGVDVFADVGAGPMLVTSTPLDTADDIVSFPATAGRIWTFALQAGSSQQVVIRGLQFYHQGVEIFPPFVPAPVTTACLWDLDGDGHVGVLDLVATITTWGETPAGPADFDCDGQTGIADLVTLILHWGPCGR